MVSLLLAVLYLAFVSLGLPDSLIGAAWPVMYQDLGASFSAAGVITMIIAAGTILSSLFSDKLTHKLGAGVVATVSTLLTALSIFGFSLSTRFWHLCMLAIPYGLGAGSIDAALNNYVALHYSSRHMSWLHASWGLGALISPYIMGACLTGTSGWTGGYRIVAIIQFVLTAVLFFSLPTWKKTEQKSFKADKIQTKPLGFFRVIRLQGVALIMIAFFCYCAAEQTTMLWASSYLVRHRAVAEETAASFGSLFFIGITAGRVLCGVITEKLGDRKMIRVGICGILAGIALIALPVQADAFALIGFVTIGLGCAPVYPSIIHATPEVFGREYSQSVIGVLMASAYTGTTFMPPLFGLIAERLHIGLLPLYLLIFTGVILLTTELLNRLVRKRGQGVRNAEERG